MDVVVPNRRSPSHPHPRGSEPRRIRRPFLKVKIMMNNSTSLRRSIRFASLSAVAVAAMALSACNRPSEVADKINTAAEKIQQSPERGAVTVEDAAITARIKAELAKDPSLSALHINV